MFLFENIIIGGLREKILSRFFDYGGNGWIPGFSFECFWTGCKIYQCQKLGFFWKNSVLVSL